MAFNNFKIIKLSRVFCDDAFCYRHVIQDPILKNSICRCGIQIQIIVRIKNGRCQIVAGHRRVAAARALKRKEIPVFEVNEKTSSGSAWLLNLISNWRQETSDMDRARALAKTVRKFKFSVSEARDSVMPLLGLPSDTRLLELYVKADSLPQDIKDLFEEKKIPFRACGTILRFSGKDRDVFAKEIGKKMQLTTSQFVQAADWLADVTRRDGKTLAAVLRAEPFKRILGHRKMDPRTRAGHFFDAVKRARFPRYEGSLEKFGKARTALLKKVPGLGIDPAAGFEEQGIDLRARLKTSRDLERVLAKLSANQTAVHDLFEVLP